MPEYPSLLAVGLLVNLSVCPALTVAAMPAVQSELRVEVCFQHGCARNATVSLDQAIVSRLAHVLATANNPGEERAAIARAIAKLESYVGAATGTDRDLGGTFPGAFRNGQMDCIDEATNTTRYLQLFVQQGWLRWHEPLEQVTRLPIPRGWWPHSTAVIRERDTGETFAVDSWFEANGQPPHIVDLPSWRRGWKPGAAQP